MATDDTKNETPETANPRRGEPRPSPIIEGAATQISDQSVEAGADSQPELSDPAAQPAQASRSFGTLVTSLALVSSLALVVALAAAGLAGALWVERGRAPPPVSSSAFAALSAHVAALNSALATARKETSDARGQAENALDAARSAQTIAQKAESSAEALAKGRSSNSAAALAALDMRIAALEKKNPPDVNAVAPLESSVAELKSRLARLESDLAALRSDSQNEEKASAGLHAEVAVQAARLAPLEALLNAPKIDVKAIEAQTAAAVGQSRASAMIVVADALRQAIAAGRPFGAETAAAARLGADPALLKPLQASAASGVETIAQLRSGFERLAGPIAAGQTQTSSKGLLGRLASEAGRLVQVRSTSETSGGSPAAIVARIEDALARGQIAEALKARAGLPKSALDVTREWAAAAQARLDALKAADMLLSSASTSIGKAPS